MQRWLDEGPLEEDREQQGEQQEEEASSEEEEEPAPPPVKARGARKRGAWGCQLAC